MFKAFIILKYFHIHTSAIKRKYPTLIVRIFLVSARTHSISRYIHIQTLCVHKRNVLRFLQHGTYHVVVRGGSRFCQSPKGGGQEFFFIKTQGRANTFLGKKYQNSPALPPKKKRTLPYDLHKLLTQRHLRNTVFDANLNSQSQAACLAHEKHVQIVGNSKIYFTILIYLYHHILAL